MRSNRVVLAAVGAAVLVLAVWFLFLWGPQSNRLSDARDRRDAAEDRNQTLEAQLARLQAAQARVPELAARLEQLRVAVPEQPNLAQFILDANDAAEQSGIDFISISPSPPAAGDAGPSSIGISISISGGYFQVLDFLNRLDGMPRIVVVDTLNISPSGEGAVELSVSVSARMFTTATPESVAGEGVAPGQEQETGQTEPETTTTTSVEGGGATTTAPGGENP